MLFRSAVGAIILTKDGRIIKGANLENSAYGCSICAERTAMFQFKLLGYKKEDAEFLACIADTDEPVSPCGSCRQVMAELLAYHTPVYLYNLKGKIKKTTVKRNMAAVLGISGFGDGWIHEDSASVDGGTG